jgi:hypothetical protein
MSLTQFIQENSSELKQCIGRALGHVPRQASCDCPKSGTDHYHDAPSLTQKDLRDWILNDESLYNWARREGVRI